MSCNDYLTYNPRATVDELVGHCGVKESSARRAISVFCKKNGLDYHTRERKVTSEEPKSSTISLSDFRRRYDVPLIIRDGLRKFFDGNDHIMLDPNFREAIGVSINNWRRYADLEEFSHNQLKLQGKIYWASTETIRRMRQICGMPEGL